MDTLVLSRAAPIRNTLSRSRTSRPCSGASFSQPCRHLGSSYQKSLPHRHHQITANAIPVVGIFLNPVVISGAWAAGAFKFWTGYGKTPFEDDAGKRAALTALWPILFATNADFRKNFKKAIQ